MFAHVFIECVFVLIVMFGFDAAFPLIEDSFLLWETIK